MNTSTGDETWQTIESSDGQRRVVVHSFEGHSIDVSGLKALIQQPTRPNKGHTMAATRVPPSTQQILQRQTADAEQRRQPKPAPASTAVATTRSQAVAVPDSGSAVESYLNDIAPPGLAAGRLVKFDGKKGEYLTLDDGEPVPNDAEFIALCDEVLIGWIRFHGEGQLPSRVAGLLYDGFVMPPRESLGDNDQNDWPAGLSGAPTDPWQHQILLPLQHTTTRELLTFGTTNTTGRRAIGNLLRTYDRTRKTAPDEVPVVRLRAGGYQHRDERIGWVNTPVFVIVGRTKRDQAAKPDTGVATDLNNEIPFN
jgi:hypothetical protein